MKPRQLLLLNYFLFFSIIISAQKKVTTKTTKTNTTISREELEKLPFSRGINEFTIMRNIGYSNFKPENGGGHTNEFDIDIDYNRFVVDNFAIGFDFDAAFSGQHYTNDYKIRNWMGYVNVIYGKPVAGKFNH